ncbi:MAG: hypothetical protein JNL98_36610 [Bryobacterales bacterium]|nr:hypothetical protein [Bryobacterales bacterium]
MTIEEAIIEKVRALPPEKKAQVLAFAESLKSKPGSKPPLKSMRGLCADLGVSISEEDIAEARREMWKSFPREEV